MDSPSSGLTRIHRYQHWFFAPKNDGILVQHSFTFSPSFPESRVTFCIARVEGRPYRKLHSLVFAVMDGASFCYCVSRDGPRFLRGY